MHRHDVDHRWGPSTRIRILMQHINMIPSIPNTIPESSIGAVKWIRGHRALFSTGVICSRIATIIKYQFGMELSLTELRQKVNDSWVEDDRVKGSLSLIRNLGPRTLAELQRVLGES